MIDLGKDPWRPRLPFPVATWEWISRDAVMDITSDCRTCERGILRLAWLSDFTVGAPDMPGHLSPQWQHQKQGWFSRVLRETEIYSQQELSQTLISCQRCQHDVVLVIWNINLILQFLKLVKECRHSSSIRQFLIHLLSGF